MKFLQSGWVVCLIGCMTYLGCTLAFLNPGKIHPVQAAEPKSEEELAHSNVPVLTGPSWEFNNPEVDQIISELRAEKETLAEKEKTLKDLEARLKADRKELMTATQTVHRLQAEFDRNVTRVREEETANLKRLAKLYATMSPDGAATVMRLIALWSCSKTLYRGIIHITKMRATGSRNFQSRDKRRAASNPARMPMH